MRTSADLDGGIVIGILGLGPRTRALFVSTAPVPEATSVAMRCEDKTCCISLLVGAQWRMKK